MTDSGKAMRGILKRLILTLAVIGALCFSAGEGLRLTPFPADDVRAALTTSADLTPSCESSVIKYGPVDLPQPSVSKSQGRSINLDSIEIVSTESPEPCSISAVFLADVVGAHSRKPTIRLRDRSPPASIS